MVSFDGHQHLPQLTGIQYNDCVKLSLLLMSEGINPTCQCRMQSQIFQGSLWHLKVKFCSVTVLYERHQSPEKKQTDPQARSFTHLRT